MSSTCNNNQFRDETGHAVVGFVGTVGLVMAIFYSLLSLVLAWYVEAVMRDAAAEGARAAALDGGHLSDAIDRTRELISTTMPEEYADSVEAYVDGTDVVVTVTADLPLPHVFATEMHVEVRMPRE